jgi:branched-chain amino acid transport system substrate-binding protein
MRKRSRVRLLAAVLALGLAAGLTSCARFGGDPDAYQLGAILPLSGQNQLFGSEFRQAIDLGVDYVNANEHLRKPLAVAYEDGQGLPQPSVTAMSKLVNVDRSIGVLTGFSTPTEATASMANDSNVVLFNGGANSPALSTLGKYVLNDLPLADQQMPAAISYAVGQRHLKRWAVLYSNETLGQSLLTAIQDQLPKAGGQVVGAVSVSSTATDFASQVAQLRQLKPDLIFLATASGTQIPTMDTQIRLAGLKSQLMSYGGTDIPTVLASPYAAGQLFATQHADLTKDNPATRYLVSEFQKRYPGTSMTTAQVNYFNAVLIMATAIKQLEGSGREVDGSALLSQILAGHSYDLAGGSVTFNPDGTTSTPIDITQLVNHKEKILTTVQPGATR